MYLDDEVQTTTKESCPLCGAELPARKTEGRVWKCCYQRWAVDNGQWTDFGLDYDDE